MVQHTWDTSLHKFIQHSPVLDVVPVICDFCTFYYFSLVITKKSKCRIVKEQILD